MDLRDILTNAPVRATKQAATRNDKAEISTAILRTRGLQTQEVASASIQRVYAFERNGSCNPSKSVDLYLTQS
jgi:hypothetical protein